MQKNGADQRQPSSKTIPVHKHHVIVLHGLSEVESSMIGLKPILEQVRLFRDSSGVPTADPEKATSVESFVPHFFMYETGKGKKQIYDFAKDLNQFVKAELFADGKKLSSADKVSVIGYSQGGLVGLVWVFLNLREGDPEMDPQNALKADGFVYKKLISNQLRNYISLATPFWGSAVAAMALDQQSLPHRILTATLGPLDQLFKVLNISEDELNGLHNGNKLYHTMRKAALSELGSESPFKSTLRGLRVLNIGGVLSTEKHPDFLGWDADFDQVRAETLNRNQLSLAKVAKFANGYGDPYLESDMIVSLPNSRLSFLAQSADSTDYKDLEVTSLNDFLDLAIGQHVAVEAPHISLVKSIKPFEMFQNFIDSQPIGIADISQECGDEAIKKVKKTGLQVEFVNSNCVNYNPSLFLILNHLQEEPTSKVYEKFPQLLSIERALKTFSMDFHISLGKEKKAKPAQISIEILGGSPNSSSVKMKDISVHTKLQAIGDPAESPEESALFRSTYIGRAQGAWLSPGHRPKDENGNEKFEEKYFTQMVRVKIGGKDSKGQKLKSRIVEVPIRPTFTTFVDVYLE